MALALTTAPELSPNKHIKIPFLTKEIATDAMTVTPICSSAVKL
jgi:hypothetical protein